MKKPHEMAPAEAALMHAAHWSSLPPSGREAYASAHPAWSPLTRERIHEALARGAEGAKEVSERLRAVFDVPPDKTPLD